MFSSSNHEVSSKIHSKVWKLTRKSITLHHSTKTYTIMDTQKNKFSNGTQKKGGKDVTRMVLTASGGVAVGAAGAAGAAALNQSEALVEPEKEEDLSIQAEQAQVVQEQPAQQVVTPSKPPVSSDEIQPIDNSSNIQTEPVNNNQPVENDVDSTIDNVDPTLIAEEITATEIDPNDNDMADMINVDMVDTLYVEDGTEMPVALFHTPDGGEFLMVDLNNDLTFDVVTDLEGNPVLAVESNLTMSDIEDMMDDSGNMLAFNEEQNNIELAQGGNPEDDIIATDNPDDDPWNAGLPSVNEGQEEEEFDDDDNSDFTMENVTDDNLDIDDIS